MTENQDSYIAGTCNIGPAEIRRRRVVMYLGLFLSLITLMSFQASHASRMDRLSIILPALVFSIGFVQSRRKFCLAYGFLGTFNFGKIGAISKVQSKADKAADRAMALRISLEALALTAVIVAVTLITA